MHQSNSVTKHKRSRQRRLAIMTAALLGFAPLASQAIPISGSGSLGQFSGPLTYSSSSATQGQLSLSLTNDSALSNGGFITGFVLNNPDDSITDISGTTFSDSEFSKLGLGDDSINGSPFGLFDFGAALGGNFEGGGSPNGGIGVGDTATFTFDLTGSGLDGLSAQSFTAETSSSASNHGGQGAQSLVVRFRGFEGGGSDKVPADGTPPPPQVPAPSGLFLFALGLVGLLGMSRKFISNR